MRQGFLAALACNIDQNLLDSTNDFRGLTGIERIGMWGFKTACIVIEIRAVCLGKFIRERRACKDVRANPKVVAIDTKSFADHLACQE